MGSQLGTNGTLAVAEMLRSNPALASLDMSADGLGDLGAAAVGEALLTNSTLRELNICIRYAK